MVKKYKKKRQKDSFRFIHISTDEVYGSLGIKVSFLKEPI